MNRSRDENVKLFKTIFDQTPVSTQIFTPDGNTIMVNDAWEKLWNIKFRDLKSYNILKDRQLVEKGLMPFVKRGFRGETVNLPAIIYNAQKTVKIDRASTRWLSAKMYPIKDAEGKITHIVLQHEDITERKRFSEILRHSEERFRTLASHAPVGIFLTDKEGNCLFVNDRWCKYAGMKREDAMGSGWANALHPDDKEDVSKAWYAFANTGKEFNMEYRFLTPKGKITWLIGSAVAIYDHKKNITGYMGTVSDITERKKTLDSLERSEERLRLALEAGQIGVWDWDITNNMLTWTDKVFEIHGVKKGKFEVNLENFKNLIHPDDRKTVLRKIEKALTIKEVFNIEFRIITPHGDERWISTRATVAYDKNQIPIRMLGATSDITHLKQVEQEQSDFISMASHELKTPITSMKISAELLKRELHKLQLDKPIAIADKLTDQTQRLAILINDLLDVSRIETGKLQLKTEAFNLRGLIEETIESLQTTSQHRLIFKDVTNAPVIADKYRIFQVVANLITNAVKYSPNATKVIISLKKDKNSAIVSVKDYGIGIEKSKQSKVFERLYQVTDQKSRSFSGLGLGLYISKEIIELHKGRIWVKSEKGKGATFFFSIPLQKGLKK